MSSTIIDANKHIGTKPNEKKKRKENQCTFIETKQRPITLEKLTTKTEMVNFFQIVNTFNILIGT